MVSKPDAYGFLKFMTFVKSELQNSVSLSNKMVIGTQYIHTTVCIKSVATYSAVLSDTGTANTKPVN